MNHIKFICFEPMPGPRYYRGMTDKEAELTKEEYTQGIFNILLAKESEIFLIRFSAAAGSFIELQPLIS